MAEFIELLGVWFFGIKVEMRHREVGNYGSPIEMSRRQFIVVPVTSLYSRRSDCTCTASEDETVIIKLLVGIPRKRHLLKG